MMKFLWWCAGADAEDMAKLPSRTQLQYATLGLVVVLNLLLLMAVWCEVGWRYFGAIGLIVPGLVVPTMFVLGLDRLIAMRRRRLTGEFAEMEPPGADATKSKEPIYRVLFALIFSALTTFTFMLDLSAEPIRAAQTKEALAANEPLRAEYSQRITGAASVMQSQAQARLTEIDDEAKALEARIVQAQAVVQQTEQRARSARDEAAEEAGGLGRKVEGEGPRFRAQMQLAAQNDRAAAEAGERLQAVQQQKTALAAEAAALRQSLTQSAAAQASALGQVEQAIASDSRYQRPQSGLFADATTFLSLYADPKEGLGRVLFTLLLLPVMAAFECVALLAFALNPISPLDVKRIAGNREAAAKVMADNTMEMARQRSRHDPIGVQPLAGGQPDPQAVDEEPPQQNPAAASAAPGASDR